MQLLINYLETINLRWKVLKLKHPTCSSSTAVFKEKNRLVSLPLKPCRSNFRKLFQLLRQESGRSLQRTNRSSESVWGICPTKDLTLFSSSFRSLFAPWQRLSDKCINTNYSNKRDFVVIKISMKTRNILPHNRNEMDHDINLGGDFPSYWTFHFNFTPCS